MSKMKLVLCTTFLTMSFISSGNVTAQSAWSLPNSHPDFVHDELRPNFSFLFKTDDFDKKYPSSEDRMFEGYKKAYEASKGENDFYKMNTAAQQILQHWSKRNDLPMLEADLKKMSDYASNINYSGDIANVNKVYEHRITMLEWCIEIDKYKKDNNKKYNDLQQLYAEIQNRSGGYYSIYTVKSIIKEIQDTNIAIENEYITREKIAHPQAILNQDKAMALFQSNPNGAMKLIDSSISISPNYSPYFYVRSIFKMKNKDYMGQKDDLLKAINLYKNYNVAKYYDALGLAYINLKDYKNAKEAFSKAANSDYTIPEFNDHLIYAAEELEKIENPKAFEYYTSAKAKYEKSDFVGSFNDANDAISINPKYPAYVALRGASTYGLVQIKNAIPEGANIFNDFNIALGKNKRNADIIAMQAGVNYSIGVEGEYSEGSSFAQTSTKKPYRIAAYNSLFNFLLERPNSKDALDKLKFIEENKHVAFTNDFSKFMSPPQVTEFHYASEGKIYSSNGTVRDTNQQSQHYQSSGNNGDYAWSNAISEYCKASSLKDQKSALCTFW